MSKFELRISLGRVCHAPLVDVDADRVRRRNAESEKVRQDCTGAAADLQDFRVGHGIEPMAPQEGEDRALTFLLEIQVGRLPDAPATPETQPAYELAA